MAIKMKFTDTAIKALPLTETKTYYSDTEIKSLRLRVGSRDKVFCLVKRLKKGPVREMTIGPWPVITTEMARKRAYGLLLDIEDGIDPKVKTNALKGPSSTLLSVTEKYIEWKKDLLSKSSAEKFYRKPFKLHLSDLLHKPISELTPEVLKETYLKITNNNTRSQTSAHILYRSLSSVFKYAVRNKIVSSDPVSELKNDRVFITPKVKNRILFEHELPVFYKYLSENSGVSSDCVFFILLTGCRRSEASSLPWSAVDLENKILHFKVTKTKEPRSLPITNSVFEILMRRKKDPQATTFVFPGKSRTGHIEEPRFFLDKLISKTKLETFCLHDLRRTYITFGKVTSQSDLVDHLVGHSSGSVSQKHYQRPTPEMLRPAAEAISEKLLSLCLSQK